MTNSPRQPHPRRRLRRAIAILSVALIVAVVGVGIVSNDVLGTGRLFDRAVAKVDRILAGPVPERSEPPTVLITDPADTSDGSDDADTTEPPSSPGATAAVGAGGPSLTPVPAPQASPTATPKPPRVPVDVDIVKDHKAVFAHEIKDTWCAAAGVQMALTILGHGNISGAFQRELQSRVHEWESYDDSHNGDWGPSAMVQALDAYGARGYQVRAYKTRQGAERDAARAIEKTGSPVLLMAWRGAHTWVMTGFRADADPAVFSNATIEGAYINDPWYPTISSIWGPSDPPGTFQDSSEMIRNYLVWKRPEGHYPERDGLFIAVVPTVVVKPAS
ncbi:MAG TPA: papain-like cysteine protease family protein [Candidatus Limnocylindrales bacterium]